MARRKGLGMGLGALIPGAEDSTNNSVDAIREVAKAPLRSAETTKGGPSDAKKSAAKKPAAKQLSPALGNAVIRQELSPISGVRYAEIALDVIIPNKLNPRKNFDQEYIKSLAVNIKEFGVLQPIRVREEVKDGLATGQYEIIMGENRFRASKLAKTGTIPAIIADVKDDNMLTEALIENIHRVDLNPLEVAAAYRSLMDDFGLTQEKLAGKLGMSRPKIANTLRLLSLPMNIQTKVASGVLSEGHARALISVKDLAAQEKLAKRIIEVGISVRGAEEAVAMLDYENSQPDDAKSTKNIKTSQKPSFLIEFSNQLEDALDTTVKINLSKRRGQIVVDFADADDLKRIVDVIVG